MSKKKSYMSLLKEAITEFDTSDNLDVKGPMLDPILSWDGGGELPVYKDAASILERYYFNEDKDDPIKTLDEMEYENDKGTASGPGMENAKGTGTEQAGTSDAATVPASKDEKAKLIAKEQDEPEEDEDKKEPVEEKEFNDKKDVPEGKEYTDESEELEMENAIIEKLIAEMEEEDDDEKEEVSEQDEKEEDEKEEVEEADVMNYTGEGPKDEAPQEKKASGPEEDTKGAGTEQAGTGIDAGQVPDRKDVHDKLVKPKDYSENTQIEQALAELEKEILEQDETDLGDEDEEKELDVDKEMAKEQAPPPPAPSAVPGGPSPKTKGEDEEEDEAAYSEAFNIFKEAIENDEEEEDEKEKE